MTANTLTAIFALREDTDERFKGHRVRHCGCRHLYFDATLGGTLYRPAFSVRRADVVLGYPLALRADIDGISDIFQDC